jgi:plastocyanin/sugar lactone lactonase YvrE
MTDRTNDFGARRDRRALLLIAVMALGLLMLGGVVPAAADGPTVPIRDFAFPPEIAVQAGDVVTWVNEDLAIPHNVVAGAPGDPTSGGAFASEYLQPGEAFSFIFEQPGTYDYFCSLHPNMRGSVVVTEASTEAASIGVAGSLAAQPAGARVVASGLLNPRGFTFAPDGALVVAETGVAEPGFQPVGVPPPADFRPPTSKTGRILRVDLTTGERTTLADGLTSTTYFLGDTLGPTSVAYLGSDLYVAISAGPVHGWPFFPSGVYRVNPDGTVRLVGNTDAFNLRNPATFVAPDEEISNPYDMLAADGALWLTDGNVNQVYRITPGSPVTRFADLSTGHPVTTGLARAQDGALVVVELTPVPFVEGSGRIMRIGPDGQVGELFRGTTAATGVAVAADGTVYVVEHSISLGQPPFLQPGTGRVARVTNGHLETVVDGLTFPTMARIGPDGALYVANFSVYANGGEGQILRVDLAGQ